MPKPICVKCGRFYRMHEAGVTIEERMPARGRNEVPPMPGWHESDRWQPYKAWKADLWKCPECGHELIQGFGLGPFAEHYQTDYDERVARMGGLRFIVNDC